MLRARQKQTLALVGTILAGYLLVHNFTTTSPAIFFEKRSNSWGESCGVNGDGCATNFPEELTEEIADVDTSRPFHIMLLSTMPRSGSTVLTDLLRNIENSVMFFEPLWLVEKNTTLYNNVTYVNNYMKEIFTCEFSEFFHKWLKDKGLFVQYFSKALKECNKMKDPVEKDQCRNLRKMCNEAPIREMKLIRARLRWTEALLQDPELNLKIIHLARDPRGSLNSIRKFNWNAEPFLRCTQLEDDLVTYENFRKLYPRKVMQVFYEDFCLHPEEITKKIFRFLFGNQPLPQVIKEFVSKHMTQETKGSMSTYKNGKVHYDKWRFDIPESQLTAIEKEPSCRSSIYRMGYNVLGSIENARNASISVLQKPS